MIKTALDALQVAIDNRLTNDTTLQARGVGCYDFVPEGSTLPYVEYGDDTVNDFSTKTFNGEDITKTLHVWSDYEGKSEAQQIMSLILQSLTAAPLVLSGGFVVDSLQREFMEVLGPDDAGFYHGILRLRIRTTQ